MIRSLDSYSPYCTPCDISDMMSLDMARVFALFTKKQRPMLIAPALNKCTPSAVPRYESNTSLSMLCGGDLHMWSVLVPLLGCVFASPLLLKAVYVVPVGANVDGLDASVSSFMLDRLPVVGMALATCVLRLLLLLWGMQQTWLCDPWMERVCCALYGWVFHMVVPTVAWSLAAMRFVPSFLDVFLVEYLLLEYLCAAVASFVLSRLNGRTFALYHDDWLRCARVQGGAFHYILFCLCWGMLCLSPLSGIIREWREASMCVLWVALGYAYAYVIDVDVCQYAWVRSLVGNFTSLDGAVVSLDKARETGVESVADMLWLWLYRPVVLGAFVSTLACVVCDTWADRVYVFMVSGLMLLSCVCGLFAWLRLYASVDPSTGSAVGMALVQATCDESDAMKYLARTIVGRLVGPFYRRVLLSLFERTYVHPMDVSDFAVCRQYMRTRVWFALAKTCTRGVGWIHKTYASVVVMFSNAMTVAATFAVSALIVVLVCLLWTKGLLSVRAGLHLIVSDFEFWGGMFCSLLHLINVCVAPNAVLSQESGRAMLNAVQTRDVGALAGFCGADMKKLTGLLFRGDPILFYLLWFAALCACALACAYSLGRMGRRFSGCTIVAVVVVWMLVAVVWVQSDTLQRSLAERLIGLLRWYIEGLKSGVIADQEGLKRAALGKLISADLQDPDQVTDLLSLRHDAGAAVTCTIGRLCSVPGTRLSTGLLAAIIANHSQSVVLPSQYALHCGLPSWNTTMTVESWGDLGCAEHEINKIRWDRVLHRARAAKRTFELIEEYFVDPGHSNVIWTSRHRALVQEVILRQLVERAPLLSIPPAPTADQVLRRIASMDWATAGEILYAGFRSAFEFGSFVKSSASVEYWMNLVNQVEATERDVAQRQGAEAKLLELAAEANLLKLEAEAKLNLEAEANLLKLEAEAKLVNVTGNESASPADTFAPWLEAEPVDEAGLDVPLASCGFEPYAIIQWFRGQKQYCDQARYMTAFEYRRRYG